MESSTLTYLQWPAATILQVEPLVQASLVWRGVRNQDVRIQRYAESRTKAVQEGSSLSQASGPRIAQLSGARANAHALACACILLRRWKYVRSSYSHQTRSDRWI